MSIEMVTAVLERSATKGSERLLLVVLAEKANADRQCWPSIETIARLCNCSKRYAIRLIQSLEDAGEITVSRQHRTNSLYTITLDSVNYSSPNECNSRVNHRDVRVNHRDVRVNHRDVLGEPLITPTVRTIRTIKNRKERARDNDSRGPSNDQPANDATPSQGTAKANSENGKGHSRSAAKRRSQFSTDWWPSPAGEQFAALHGCQDLAANVAACIDKHREKGNTFVDHDAAWRTWCRNAVRYGWATDARSASNHRGSKAESERSAYADRLLAATIEAGDERPQTPDRGRFDA